MISELMHNVKSGSPLSKPEIRTLLHHPVNFNSSQSHVFDLVLNMKNQASKNLRNSQSRQRNSLPSSCKNSRNSANSSLFTSLKENQFNKHSIINLHIPKSIQNSIIVIERNANIKNIKKIKPEPEKIFIKGDFVIKKKPNMKIKSNLLYKNRRFSETEIFKNSPKNLSVKNLCEKINKNMEFAENFHFEEISPLCIIPTNNNFKKITVLKPKKQRIIKKKVKNERKIIQVNSREKLNEDLFGIK